MPRFNCARDEMRSTFFNHGDWSLSKTLYDLTTGLYQFPPWNIAKLRLEEPFLSHELMQLCNCAVGPW